MIAPQIRFERRLKLLAFSVGMPGSAVALVLLWTGNYDPKLSGTLGLFIVIAWWIAVATLVHRVVFPLQTLSN